MLHFWYLLSLDQKRRNGCQFLNTFLDILLSPCLSERTRITCRKDKDGYQLNTDLDVDPPFGKTQWITPAAQKIRMLSDKCLFIAPALNIIKSRRAPKRDIPWDLETCRCQRSRRTPNKVNDVVSQYLLCIIERRHSIRHIG